MSTEVARTILEQLGGGRFLVMTGARHLIAYPDALVFALPRFPGVKVAKVKITLDPSDTYNIDLYRKTGTEYPLIGQHWGVYAEDLARTFTDLTGLETNMGSIRRAS
jgi:hypothetical protein